MRCLQHHNLQGHGHMKNRNQRTSPQRECLPSVSRNTDYKLAAATCRCNVPRRTSQGL
uniref:Uncharacterized protein n=1 Tax=Arundo donax TaxID=35708 RepID=A0A0A8Z1I9_ARUDO